jgi:hypothetical protein
VGVSTPSTLRYRHDKRFDLGCAAVSNVARTLVTLVVGFFALILWPGRADAYPWMIRHEYNNCIACHVDPSGGGLLTPYGRGQSQVLLSTKYSNEEVNPGKFIFFAGFAELPNSVNLGAWFRTGYISRGTDAKGDTPASRKGDLVAMRYDFQAQVNVDKVKFNLSLGITPRDEAGGQTQAAWVTRRLGVNPQQNIVPKEVQVVSREHWIGYEVSDAIMLRAGRINVPFGLRNFEHNAWVRAGTRTDYNQQQQHGLTASYGDEHVRGEVMAILGNYQIGPDGYRERGYSGYVEFAVGQYQAVGFSSLMTYAKIDQTGKNVPVFRQAHGPYTRYTITKPVVLLAEVDIIANAFKDQPTYTGWAGWLQADIEAVQGVHLLGTGEFYRAGLDKFANESTNYGLWAGIWWFPIPHLDFRVDAIRRFGPSPFANGTTYLAQLHVYL